MSGYLSLQGSFFWYFMWLAALLLLTGHLYAFLVVARKVYPSGRRDMFFAVLHFLGSAAVFTILLDGFYKPPEYEPRSFYGFERMFFSLPWGVWAVAEVLSAVFLMRFWVKMRRYRHRLLSMDTVREAVDLLPAALCISDPDGTVLLANLKMRSLCHLMTGSLLTDARTFWMCVERINREQAWEEGIDPDWKEAKKVAEDAAGKEEGEVHYLIRTVQGEVWQFSRDRIEVDGREYDQILAEDMTARFLAAREMAVKNRHLRDVQDKMRMISVEEHGLIREREIMNARRTVHNQIGNVLLTGKYYMDHPDNVDEEELLRLLEYNNHFLIEEARQQSGKPDTFREAMHTARRIGVTVRTEGAVPESGEARDLIAQAIEQCAANTLRHAGGDELTIQLESFPAVPVESGGEEISRLFVTITNNGSAPEGVIREGGGLGSLRRAVEGSGGTMEIESSSGFVLKLKLPLS